MEEFEADPFLCDDCQQYGYCRKISLCSDENEHSRNEPVSAPLQNMPVPLSDEEIRKWIIESKWEETVPFQCKATFKEAIHLFQEKKYDQAANSFNMIRIYEDVPAAVGYGSAACLYFQKDPDQAALMVSRITEPDQKEMRLRFIRSCEIQKRLNTLKSRSFHSLPQENKKSEASVSVSFLSPEIQETTFQNTAQF